MMSDIVFEAELGIAQYLKEYPEIYGKHRRQILAVVAGLNKLRRKIDGPFVFGVHPAATPRKSRTAARRSQ